MTKNENKRNTELVRKNGMNLMQIQLNLYLKI